MKKSLYVLMRRANMQGMTTTFHLEPDRLGPQVRKNAVRMLREGFVHGRGNAANVALSVAEHVGIKLPHNYYGETTIMFDSPYTAESKDKIVEKMRSCITAEILTENSDWRQKHLKDELSRVGEMFAKANYIRFYGMKTDEVREFLLPFIKPALKERLEHAAQMLLASTAIHIETYRSN
jgi:hypothetical protein